MIRIVLMPAGWEKHKNSFLKEMVWSQVPDHLLIRWLVLYSNNIRTEPHGENKGILYPAS